MRKSNWTRQQVNRKVKELKRNGLSVFHKNHCFIVYEGSDIVFTAEGTTRGYKIEIAEKYECPHARTRVNHD